MERSSFTRKFIGNGEISGLNQLITAVTRNCCFSVSCSSFFPIFVCGNGENSVAEPQLRVAAKRYALLIQVTMEKTSKEKRLKVLEYSLKLEALASFALSYILDINNYQNSKSFGNTSSSLSFNQKINLLLDCRSIEKVEKFKFDVFMGIRNQFMHNLKCKTFEEAFELNTGTKNKIQKIYPVCFELNNLELSLELCVDSLYEDCIEILTAKKGITEQKIKIAAELSVYKKVIGAFNNTGNSVFDNLYTYILSKEYESNNKEAILRKLEDAKTEIFVTSIENMSKT